MEATVKVKLAEGYKGRFKVNVKKGEEIVKRFAEAGDTVEIPARYYVEAMGKIVGGDEEAVAAAEAASATALPDPDADRAKALAALSGPQLKALAKDSGIDDTGSKGDLVKRLSDAGIDAP